PIPAPTPLLPPSPRHDDTVSSCAQALADRPHVLRNRWGPVGERLVIPVNIPLPGSPVPA
ncbi:hypothetical protein, partial [Pandoraea apista]|uniref:hypothetical protein n=1 Tax=Pandoraea apista TaxID=93218 RepID=UPI001C0ED089